MKKSKIKNKKGKTWTTDSLNVRSLSINPKKTENSGLFCIFSQSGSVGKNERKSCVKSSEIMWEETARWARFELHTDLLLFRQTKANSVTLKKSIANQGGTSKKTASQGGISKKKCVGARHHYHSAGQVSKNPLFLAPAQFLSIGSNH